MCVCARVGGADKSSALTNKEVTQSLEGLKAAEAHTSVCVFSGCVFARVSLCVWWVGGLCVTLSRKRVNPPALSARCSSVSVVFQLLVVLVVFLLVFLGPNFWDGDSGKIIELPGWSIRAIGWDGLGGRSAGLLGVIGRPELRDEAAGERNDQVYEDVWDRDEGNGSNQTGTLIYFQVREVQILSSVQCLRLRRVYFSESNTVKVIFMRIAQVRTIIP